MHCSRVLMPLLAALVIRSHAAYSRELINVTNLTLAAAVEQAVSENLELKSLRAKWESMLERPIQAGALPNPMLTYGGMDMAEGGEWPDTGEKRIMAQQEFPWFGKRTLRTRIAMKEAESLRHELERKIRDVIMSVKENYYDLCAVRKVIAITTEEQAVLQSMTDTAGTQYAAGVRDQVDVLKAQTEVSMLKQKLLDLQAREITRLARLNTTLNRRADTPLGTVQQPPEITFPGTFESLFTVAVTNWPDVLAAQTQVDRYALEQQLMDKESFPDYKLGVEYRDVDAGDNMLMFTVSVALPIWRKKNSAAVREAEKMKVSSEASREAAKQKNALDIQESLFNLQTAQRKLVLIRTELLPQAEARFRASEVAYRTGKVDFMDFLESERFRLNTKTMAAMEEGSAGMQAARLERALGTEMSTSE